MIIWPEAATPYNLQTASELKNELRDIIPYTSYLALGSVRVEEDVNDRNIEKNRKFYNSVEFINSDGELEKANYDKFHLVPFGEYMPLRKFLPGIEKITHGSNDFSKGAGPTTIELDGFPSFSPLICYEIIFPGNVVNKQDRKNSEGPKWLLNVTNDGWFGQSSGPYQHLDIARARAIEEGMPVVRAANTGISAVIDSLGIVKDSIGLNESGIIDTNLPAKLHFETFFAIYGLIIPILLIGFVLSSAVCLKFYGRSSQ